MLTRIVNLLKWLKKISFDSKRNILFLLIDFLSLKRKKTVSRLEYQNYKMYAKSKDFREGFLSYAGACKYWTLLNPLQNACLARNKFLSHCLLESVQIPKSELYVYYNPELSHVEDYFANDYNSVKNILLNKKISTFVVKPASDSAHGEGVFICKKIKFLEDDCFLIKQDGTLISLKKLLGKVSLLFEELIIQSSQMMSFNSSSVNTIRIMTALFPEGEVRTIAAFIKIGRKGSEIDNAGNGGNIDCGVEINSGRLFNAVEFNSWSDIRNISSHPDSGAILENVEIKDWLSIRKQVEIYQAKIPFLKTIGWDVAITEKGPLIVEINNWWDTTGQLFINRGWEQQIQECYKAWSLYYQK